MTINKYVLLSFVLVVGLGAGYWYGATGGYDKGYEKALADVKSQQEEIAKNNAEEAARSSNPFKVENPLEGVEADPFAKAKASLNPFSGE